VGDDVIILASLPRDDSEEWRVVPSHLGYAVSSRGRVARFAPVPHGIGEPGQLRVVAGGAAVLLPASTAARKRLLALAFPDLPLSRRHTRLSREDVRAIRAVRGQYTAAALAVRFGVIAKTISNIWEGETHRGVPPLSQGHALARIGPSVPRVFAVHGPRRPRTMSLTDAEADRLRTLGGGNLRIGVQRLLAERDTGGG